MIKHKTNLDGSGLIEGDYTYFKGDCIKVIGTQEGYYTVRSMSEEINLRMIKYVENIEYNENSKNNYILNSEYITFENKLSKNQMILVNDNLYKIVDTQKKLNKLTVEKIEVKVVYELTVATTNGKEYFFKDLGEAFGHVMCMRDLGVKSRLGSL